jgi:hypothetical protein
MKNITESSLIKYFAFGLFLYSCSAGASLGIVGGLCFACQGKPFWPSFAEWLIVIAGLAFLTILMCRAATKTITLISVINGVTAGYLTGFFVLFGLVYCLVAGVKDTIAGFKGIFGG